MRQERPKMADESAIPSPRAVVANVIGWGVTLAGLNRLGSVALSLVLVRLISPEAYGQYGLVNSILMFAMTFSMQRFMEHTFHANGEHDLMYREHLGFGILLHVVLFVCINAFFALAPLQSNYAEIRQFAMIGSISILLNIPRIYYSTHLRRIHDWRRIRILHVISFLLSAAVSLAFALAGFGVMALLAQTLIIPIPYAVDLVFQRKDLVAVSFRFAPLRQSIRFGLVRSSGGLVGVTRTLVEASLFSKQAGFAHYGVYGRALGLSALGCSWFADQIHGVLYPVMARLAPRSQQSQRAAGLLLRLALWTSVPFAAALIVFNDSAVLTLYGPGWSEVAVLLPPALGVTVVGVIIRALGLIVLITEGATAVLTIELGLLVVYVIGVVFALDAGVLAYLWFLLLGNATILLALLVVLLIRKVVTIEDVASATLPMTTLGLLVIFALNSQTLSILDAHHSPASLAGGFVVFAAVAVVSIRLIDAQGLSAACAYLPCGAQLARVLRLQ